MGCGSLPIPDAPGLRGEAWMVRRHYDRPPFALGLRFVALRPGRRSRRRRSLHVGVELAAKRTEAPPRFDQRPRRAPGRCPQMRTARLAPVQAPATPRIFRGAMCRRDAGYWDAPEQNSDAKRIAGTRIRARCRETPTHHAARGPPSPQGGGRVPHSEALQEMSRSSLPLAGRGDRAKPKAKRGGWGSHCALRQRRQPLERNPPNLCQHQTNRSTLAPCR
jgi:hypothetical protein